MISLPSFNVGFRSFAEGTRQVSMALDLVAKAFATAVTLVDIANAVRAGELRLDRLATGGGLVLLARNGMLVVQELSPGMVTGDIPSGGRLYVQGGALKYLGTAGTTTTVAPA